MDGRPQPEQPPGTTYSIQVAGHQLIRQARPGSILKPWSEKEEAFYRQVHTDCCPPHLHWLRSCTPKFYGVQHSTADAHKWIELEDLNYGFHKPCVMDVKIGFRHYDDDASDYKRRKQIQSAIATTTSACAIRFVGTRSFKRTADAASHNGQFVVHDKWHGRALQPNDLLPELIWFFHDSLTFDARSAQLVLQRLQTICHNFSQQRRFYFYSSSLLIIYEGAKSSPNYPRVDVRMIDFSHTVDSSGFRDTGYLKGLQNLLRLLSQAIDAHKVEAVTPSTSTSTGITEHDR